MARILIVEDDKLLLSLYADILTGEGHQIDKAEDGIEAFEKIKTGGWDLILLDIIIPKINGLDVLEKVNQNPPINPNKCVVFLTNLDQGKEIKKALTLGDGYIIKSQITPDDLVNEVDYYLTKKLQTP